MSLEMIRLEIQKRQGRIQSLYSNIGNLQAELNEMIQEERRIGQRLGSSSLLADIRRSEEEITSLESEVRELMSEAREAEAHATPKRELNPLEMLGISAIMNADGKMSDEQFNAILEEVRKAFHKS